MAAVMEFPVFATFKSVSHLSGCLLSSKFVFYVRFFRSAKFCNRLRYSSSSKLSIRISMSFQEEDDGKDRADYRVSFLGESQFVEVIGIGSRKDAVLDFCLDSPFQLSSSLPFWNIHVKDPLKVQLQERVFGQDLNPRIIEASQFLQSHSKAIILVASAGYGLDHITTVDVLKMVRSRNGFAVAIFLRPFSFEGQKRQDEVKDLVGKLQEHTNFWIELFSGDAQESN